MTILWIILAMVITWLWAKKKYYRKGRYSGCMAVENMVMSRARRLGYNPDKIWADLLQ